MSFRRSSSMFAGFLTAASAAVFGPPSKKRKADETFDEDDRPGSRRRVVIASAEPLVIPPSPTQVHEEVVTSNKSRYGFNYNNMRRRLSQLWAARTVEGTDTATSGTGTASTASASPFFSPAANTTVAPTANSPSSRVRESRLSSPWWSTTAKKTTTRLGGATATESSRSSPSYGHLPSSSSPWNLTDAGEDMKMLIAQVILERATPRDAASAAAACKQWRAVLGPRVAAAVALRGVDDEGKSLGEVCRAMSSLITAGKHAMAPHAAAIARACVSLGVLGVGRSRVTKCLVGLGEHAAPHARAVIFALLDAPGSGGRGAPRHPARSALPDVVEALGVHALPHLQDFVVRGLSRCTDDPFDDDELRGAVLGTWVRLCDAAGGLSLRKASLKKIVDDVARLLHHAVPAVRAAALSGLCIADTHATHTLDAVVLCLRDESMEVVVAAVAVLRVMAKRARRYAYRVAAMLDDREHQKRLAGMLALGAMGEAGGVGPHADRIVAAMLAYNADDVMHAAGLRTLAAAGSAAAGRHAHVIAACVDDACPEVRAAAVDALRTLGSKAAPYLSSVVQLLTDEDEEVRDMVVAAVSELRKHLKEPDYEAIIDSLTLDDFFEEAQHPALTVIDLLGGDAVTPHMPQLMTMLVEARELHDYGLSGRIFEAMRVIGWRAKPALSVRLALLHSGRVRGRVLDANVRAIMTQVMETLGVVGDVALRPEDAGLVVEWFDDELLFVNMRLLGHVYDSFVGSGLRALEGIGDLAAPHLPVMVKALGFLEKEHAKEMKRILENLGESAAPFTGDVASVLERFDDDDEDDDDDDDDENERELITVMEALGAMGQVAAPHASAVAGRLSDARPSVRVAAVQTLSQLGVEAAAPHVDTLRRTLLEDDERDVRVAVLKCLPRLGRPTLSSVNAVSSVLEADDNMKWGLVGNLEVQTAMQTMARLAKLAEEEMERNHDELNMKLYRLNMKNGIDRALKEESRAIEEEYEALTEELQQCTRVVSAKLRAKLSSPRVRTAAMLALMNMSSGDSQVAAAFDLFLYNFPDFCGVHERDERVRLLQTLTTMEGSYRAEHLDFLVSMLLHRGDQSPPESLSSRAFATMVGRVLRAVHLRPSSGASTSTSTSTSTSAGGPSLAQPIVDAIAAEGLAHDLESVRVSSLRVMGLVGECAVPHLDAIVERLTDEKFSVRSAAYEEAFGKLEELAAPVAAHVAVLMMEERSDRVNMAQRRMAAVVLQLMGHDVWDAYKPSQLLRLTQKRALAASAAATEGEGTGAGAGNGAGAGAGAGAGGGAGGINWDSGSDEEMDADSDEEHEHDSDTSYSETEEDEDDAECDCAQCDLQREITVLENVFA